MTPLRLLHAPGSNLQPGRGDRRDDCARLESCLDGWVRTCNRYGIGPDAHCSPRCCGYEPRDTSSERDHEALRRLEVA